MPLNEDEMQTAINEFIDGKVENLSKQDYKDFLELLSDEVSCRLDAVYEELDAEGGD